MLAQLGHVVTDASPAVDWDTVLRASVPGAIGIAAPFLMAPRPSDPEKLEAVSRRILVETRAHSALS
ncbi:MAG: hypothetical protein ACRDT4_27395 [Micromonosporaceae bacterium]